jgi:hypothetical protein
MDGYYNMIRRATGDDIPALLALARRFHAGSHWPEYADYDAVSAANFVSASIKHDTAIVLCAERDGVVCGGICVVLAPLYFNDAAWVAQELYWYSESPKDAFALLKEAEREAAKAGATVFMLGSQAGNQDDRFRTVYGRLGYQPFTHGFVRGLNDGR